MKLFKLGLLFIVIGFLILIVASLLMLISSATGLTIGGVSGCVVILFIPICFGVGSPNVVVLLTLVSAILLLFILVSFLILFRSVYSTWKRIYTQSS